VNVAALDAPPDVEITTCAEDDVDAGTVRVQVFCAGQLVGATWPLNVATIRPLELKKLAPVTVIVCPAAPLAGLNDAMVGGPPGATAAVVDVEAGREVDGAVGDDVVVVRFFPVPAVAVVGVLAGGVLVAGLAAVRGGGEESPLNETISAMPAAMTSAARTATAPMSHPLADPARRASVSGSSRVSSRRGASPSGAPSRIRTSPTDRGCVGTVDDGEFDLP
jgi:hypothetical protein